MGRRWIATVFGSGQPEKNWAGSGGAAAAFGLVAALLLCLTFPGVAGAEDFRIETQVFHDDETKPASENLTLFSENTVYDFLSEPEQISVFKRGLDSKQGRFVLINPSRQERAELTAEQVLEFTSKLRGRATVQKDPLLQFAGAPRFKTQFEERTGTLTLGSDQMRYRLLTLPAKSEEAARQYQEFTDWYARLGSMLHVGSLPPFPRLAVNAALAEKKAIPREVHLSIPAQKPHRNQEMKIRSEHQITWRLSREDHKRIDQVAKYLVEFKPVPLQDFLRP